MLKLKTTLASLLSASSLFIGLSSIAHANSETPDSLRAEFVSRENIFYGRQQEQLFDLAMRMSGNPTDASFEYHQPDLFDRRSFGILTLSNLERTWVSSTDKYLRHGSGKGSGVDVSKFQVDDQTLFASVPMNLGFRSSTGQSPQSLAETRLPDILSAALGNDVSKIRETSPIYVQSRLIRQNAKSLFPLTVTAQYVRLVGRGICQVSTWISNTDRYAEVICLDNRGAPIGPRRTGGLGRGE